MSIRVIVAGATGWAGGAVARAVLGDARFALVGAVGRRHAGQDLGDVFGHAPVGITVSGTLAEALQARADVLVDYTHPLSVKSHVLAALDAGVSAVVGTSGLNAGDYVEIEGRARQTGRGVIAAGNFSLTAALAKSFALTAARYLQQAELIDYASAGKPDAPSGTVLELAEALGPLVDGGARLVALGVPETRGADIGGVSVHAVRLPGYVIAFDALFGQPDERLLIRHEAGSSAAPYVAGTLLAVERVGGITGLVRGLDRLLFPGE
ncbi:MAG: 4-hydroxy-tetrahydrodipicolinate reductase [Clostridia bacterium]